MITTFDTQYIIIIVHETSFINLYRNNNVDIYACLQMCTTKEDKKNVSKNTATTDFSKFVGLCIGQNQNINVCIKT